MIYILLAWEPSVAQGTRRLVVTPAIYLSSVVHYDFSLKMLTHSKFGIFKPSEEHCRGSLMFPNQQNLLPIGQGVLIHTNKQTEIFTYR